MEEMISKLEEMDKFIDRKKDELQKNCAQGRKKQ
jgi:hypothetical protein